MSAPSDFEQMLLEQINYARLDPQADFARYITSYDTLTSNDPRTDQLLKYYQVVGATLKAQVDALTSTAPVAWNDQLDEAATYHSENLIRHNTLAHVIGDSTPATRLRDAGYAFSTAGENVFTQTTNPINAHAGFMVDWGDASVGAVDGIQNPAGHRTTIMNPSFREVGISVIAEDDASTAWVGPYVVTQNFGTQRDLPESILVGHVRSELNGDDFYSLGEGTGGIRVSIDGASDVTPGSGGYRLDAAAGFTRVTFSGEALEQDVEVAAILKAENAKIDLIDGTSIETSVSLRLFGGATDASFIADQGFRLTGNREANTLTGNDIDNLLIGKIGHDTLKGAGGNDRLFGGLGADVLMGGTGSDMLMGAIGHDVLIGGAGNDVLRGARGRDTLTGGDGADRFVFAGTWGHDVITDFEAGDTIHVANLMRTRVNDRLVQQGEDVLFERGANSILIKDVQLSDLNPDDFGL